jgi:hypothetical protein
MSSLIKHRRILPLLALLAAFVPALAVCQEVYKWVDENGVVHYSTEAPPSEAQDVSRIELEQPSPLAESADDPFNIEATAQRTQALREDMEQRRERQRAERLEREKIAARQQVVHHYTPGHYVSPWWGAPVYPVQPIEPVPPLRPQPEPMPSVPIRWPGRSPD